MNETFGPNGIITLTTDFGLDDAYVAIMKGVILGIAPQTRIIDYTHGIKPGNISQAAYLLGSGYRYFPRGTTHVVVVDPGVGSQRRAIAMQTPEATFVGPDNGVFSMVVEEGRHAGRENIRVIELTEARFWLPQISATFHGRDIFAPVAAHVAWGVPFEELGREIDSIVPLERASPAMPERDVLAGRIIHIDHFGNCITDITSEHLDVHGLGQRLLIEIAGQGARGLFRTYADAPPHSPVCLIGSSGHLEIAVRDGHAAQYLNVDVGDRLWTRRDEARPPADG